jgi:small subunit ribosomal protein S17
MKAKEKTAKESMEIKNSSTCSDRDCQFHGGLKTRGRIFQGIVVKKFDRRITIVFERMVYLIKYERYMKSRTKIHARLPSCMKEQVNIGDLVRVQECRPLSKIIHCVFMEVIKKG